jgi:hypothetical protein
VGAADIELASEALTPSQLEGSRFVGHAGSPTPAMPSQAVQEGSQRRADSQAPRTTWSRLDSTAGHYPESFAEGKQPPVDTPSDTATPQGARRWESLPSGTGEETPQRGVVVQRLPSDDGEEFYGEVAVPLPSSSLSTPALPTTVHRADSWDNYAGLMDATPPQTQVQRFAHPKLASVPQAQLFDNFQQVAEGLAADLEPKFVLLSDDEHAESTPTTDVLLPSPLDASAPILPSPVWDGRLQHGAAPPKADTGWSLPPEPQSGTATQLGLPSGVGAALVATPSGQASGRSSPGEAAAEGQTLATEGPRPSPQGGRVVELGEEEVVVPLSVLEAAQDGLLTAAQALAGDAQGMPQLGPSPSDDEPHLVRVAAAVDIFEKVFPATIKIIFTIYGNILGSSEVLEVCA